MFIDARTVGRDDIVDTGICIIGAGAAGITLARSLRTTGIPIVVLESGDLDFDGATQDLDAGEMAGLRNYPLAFSRLRFFGGTTNHWAGTCRPFDALDFESRAAVPLSGWPLRRDDLLPFYEQAHTICELGPFNYDPDFWFGKVNGQRPDFDSSRLKTSIFQISPPTRFGRTYRQDLREADSVTVYMNANAVDLQANATASRVDRVKVSSLDGASFTVRANFVVLAAGGLENARILLLSDGVLATGLGNTNDVVGRYFMDHPYFPGAALARFAAPERPLPLLVLGLDAPRVAAFATLTDGTAASGTQPAGSEGAAGFQILLQGTHRIVEGVASLKTVAHALSGLSAPPHLWEHLGNILRDGDVIADSLYRTVTHRPTSPFVAQAATGFVPGASLDILLEQVPNPASRVTLSAARDALGQQRLVMDWQFTDVERRTYRRAQEMAALEFGRLGIGRVKAVPLPDDGWPDSLLGANHHMGTTRMSDNPKTGVVDANCRVHGMSNLYVAGSSVFPTSSYANPTLTIVALALRLGGELRRLMA